MSAPPDAAAAAARAEALFGPGVAVAARPVAGPQPPLLPPEAAALARAVPARRAEFAAGRAAARAAMAALGLPPAAVPQGADRAPVWPAGLAGSIAHGAGLALAAVARTGTAAALGLDVEPDAALPDDLWEVVLRPEERAAARACADPGRAARAVFVAKEAAYKCQYPLSRRVIGFAALAIRRDGAGGLAARFAEAVPPFPAGATLAGREAAASGLRLAGFSLPPGRSPPGARDGGG